MSTAAKLSSSRVQRDRPWPHRTARALTSWRASTTWTCWTSRTTRSSTSDSPTRPASPLLELAVGSGRLAVPLALAGHRVVGVDHDAAMLERASAAWDSAGGSIERDRLILHEADFTSFRVTTVRPGLRRGQHLPSDRGRLARLSLLGAMREQLRPGAWPRKVSTPDEDELASFDGRVQLEWLRHEPESGDLVAKMASARYDPDVESVSLCQIFEWTPAYGGSVSRVTRTDVLHLVPAVRLVDLTRQSGFGEVDLWGDHLAMPYGSRSHRAIIVARLV